MNGTRFQSYRLFLSIHDGFQLFKMAKFDLQFLHLGFHQESHQRLDLPFLNGGQMLRKNRTQFTWRPNQQCGGFLVVLDRYFLFQLFKTFYIFIFNFLISNSFRLLQFSWNLLETRWKGLRKPYRGCRKVPEFQGDQQHSCLRLRFLSG